MPELPEIRHLAGQMNEALTGKTFAGADIVNPKCLNMGADEFVCALSGRAVAGATSLGKWVFLHLDGGSCLALNLNMGGNVVLYGPGLGPRDKWRVNLRFSDGCSLSVGFWFLGYLHFIAPGQPHTMTDGLGADPLAPDFTFDAFDALLGRRKLPIKALLLRQDVIAGIGNYYIQDMLFLARVHPMKSVAALGLEERRRVYDAMRSYLQKALDLGGAWYENDLYDRPGRYREMLIGYKEGQPCPVCGTAIKKIKTGSTSGFMCERCQAL